LDQVWEMVSDAVVDGGFVCVNIGDATRTIDGSFQLFPNTAQITLTGSPRTDCSPLYL